MVTNEQHLAKWWNKGVRVEAKPGGEFYEPWMDRAGNQQLATGRVLKFKEGKFVEFSWREKTWEKSQNTVCRVEVLPQGEKAMIKVTHSNWEVFPAENRVSFRKGFSAGWKTILKRLKAYSAKKP